MHEPNNLFLIYLQLHNNIHPSIYHCIYIQISVNQLHKCKYVLIHVHCYKRLMFPDKYMYSSLHSPVLTFSPFPPVQQRAFR